MANVTVTPLRGRAPEVTVEVLDEALKPLAVKEVTLTLANPAAGIEPVRRPATVAAGALWRVENLRVPIAGRWTIRLELLVDDFTRVALEEEVELPRMP
jgi:copper transport protein